MNRQLLTVLCILKFMFLDRKQPDRRCRIIAFCHTAQLQAYQHDLWPLICLSVYLFLRSNIFLYIQRITADLDLWYCVRFSVMLMVVQHIISFALVLKKCWKVAVHSHIQHIIRYCTQRTANSCTPYAGHGLLMICVLLVLLVVVLHHQFFWILAMLH